MTFRFCPLLGAAVLGSGVYLGNSALACVQGLLASLAPPTRNSGAKEQEQYGCHPRCYSLLQSRTHSTSWHMKRGLGWIHGQSTLFPRTQSKHGCGLERTQYPLAAPAHLSCGLGTPSPTCFMFPRMHLEQPLQLPIGQHPRRPQVGHFSLCQLSFPTVSNRKSPGARLWGRDSSDGQDPGTDTTAACRLRWGAGDTGPACQLEELQESGGGSPVNGNVLNRWRVGACG